MIKQIKVLIVDDSAFMRKALTSILQSDSVFDVVGVAQNGREGIEKAMSLRPDIITMDLEMPVMNGLDALREIMNKFPTPVVMISSLTSQGAQATIDALSLGAVDFITKQANISPTQMERMREEVISKLKAISQSHSLKSRLERTQTLLNSIPVASAREKATTASVVASQNTPQESTKRLTLQERIALRKAGQPTTQETTSPAPRTFTHHQSSATESSASTRNTKTAGQARTTGKRRPDPSTVKIIVLGISTGGPLALHNLVPRLPKELPVPILIVQHMPPHFTKSLADRLNSLSHITVREAQDQDILSVGTVYIAPGGFHLTVAKDNRSLKISTEPARTLHRPSVDVMVDSVVERFGGNVLGIIMTGMGRDGCAGLKKLHQNGGYILAQDEESCVVYGMPKAVVDEGIADEIHSLDNLPEAISSCLGLRAVSPKSA